MIKIVGYIGRALRDVENFSLALFMFGMFVLVMYTVLIRYILGGTLPSSWAEILVRLVLACVTFFGATVIEREQGHFAIGVMMERLNTRLRLSVKILADIIVIVFLAIMAKEAVIIVPDQMHQFSGSWSIVPFGLWPLLILIMAVLMICYIIMRIIKNIKEVFKP